MNPMQDVETALRDALQSPCLKTARSLLLRLRSTALRPTLLGRQNQKASIEANSGSDRGVAERLANAFDATLKEARERFGIKSTKDLVPRKAAQKFFCANQDIAEWLPIKGVEDVQMPRIQFWKEDPATRVLHKKYQSKDGLATVLVNDGGCGIAPDQMAETILTLNSASKLKEFDAIGQFGHGGSSSLFFCELVLIASATRLLWSDGEFAWTVIYVEHEIEDSKQPAVRKWFSQDGMLPITTNKANCPEMDKYLPGTAIWHFGYDCDGWIQPLLSSRQNTPWGRLGRLLFSYPLPFRVSGEMARADGKKDGYRTLRGAFYRLRGREERLEGKPENVYFGATKDETLIVDGETYGSFSITPMVLDNEEAVRTYVDKAHPIILTLNGQNHGELTDTLLINAKLPILASSMIVEVRLDNLIDEALSQIISNSREQPKSTPFTQELRRRLADALESDDALKAMEKKRQDERAKQGSKELNSKLQTFLNSVLSNARAEPNAEAGDDSAGEGGGGGAEPTSRDEVPEADPPLVLSFLTDSPLRLPVGVEKRLRFKTDARPPKYSFLGDSPRLFVRLSDIDPDRFLLSVTNRSDPGATGYGSVKLALKSTEAVPAEGIRIGEVQLALQTTDGRMLQAQRQVLAVPVPQKKERSRARKVRPDIRFCVPEGYPVDEIKGLFGEDTINAFGVYLRRLKERLSIDDLSCAYWGERESDEDGDKIVVEINAANTLLLEFMRSCTTVSERLAGKEAYCRDVLLDCYQHRFTLEELPSGVQAAIDAETPETVAAEFILNHFKAVRSTLYEREKARATRK